MVGRGKVYPLTGDLPIKKSHAAESLKKRSLAGCGGALSFCANIITKSKVFCQALFHTKIIESRIVAGKIAGAERTTTLKEPLLSWTGPNHPTEDAGIAVRG